MHLKTILFTLTLFVFNNLLALQKVKDFYYVEPETENLPVFIRGNLEAKKILIYVQGGGAENGIDFGRSDYPKWKNTLEKEVAIAYFDQRGLNRSVKKIDTGKINSQQVLKDIITIAESIKEKYQADIYLFGHSMGGVDVLRCLSIFPKETSFIKSGIVFNTPITSDFSPERYNYYRPLYLKNLSKEFIEQKKDTVYWQEAYNWMSKIDSIATIEDSGKWNAYVDRAFNTRKRNIGLGMVLKTIFSRPYNPIKYLNNKDNKFVADRLWYSEKELWDTGKQVPIWEILPKIKHPILLITGRYDAIAVPEEQKEAHKLIENSKLVIIPNCTHESYLVQPELFNSAVISFLE
jgi:pimeloyl-ACP methyl ester carboxylesterase